MPVELVDDGVLLLPDSPKSNPTQDIDDDCSPINDLKLINDLDGEELLWYICTTSIVWYFFIPFLII